jgi:hypothetical protein
MKTRMTIFVMGLLLFGVNLTNAQIGDQTSIGPRVGVNFSSVSNVDNSESLTGLVAGLTFTYSINKATGFTADLLYSEEGYTVNGSEHRLNYLQIPILFDLFFGELGQKFRPKVYAGLAPSFLLNANVNGNKVEDFYNPFTIAVAGGLGFNYKVGNRIWLNTDLRGFLGLSDIREEPSGDTNAGRNIQLSVGLAYGLSKI